jgi:hypothetical protein
MILFAIRQVRLDLSKNDAIEVKNIDLLSRDREVPEDSSDRGSLETTLLGV